MAVKVRPHYAARQKLRHATSICGCCVGMPFDATQPKNSIGKLSVPSKEAVRHMISKGFQNGISQFEKKIRPSSPISFHSFGNPKVCKKFFFHADAIALATYAEQLLPRGKAALCCILPRGIVWTHLYGTFLPARQSRTAKANNAEQSRMEQNCAHEHGNILFIVIHHTLEKNI